MVCFSCDEDMAEETQTEPIVVIPNDSGSNDNDDDDNDDNAPTPPVLVFPLNETECSNDNLTFEWNSSTGPSGGNITYTLYISTSPDFTNDVETYPTIDTYYALNLPQSTALYWKVEAFTATSNSFSETRSLYTQGNGVNNNAPQLEYLSPNNDVTINTNSITLQWQGSDVETSNNNLVYKVYFSEVGSNLNLLEENYYGTQYFINGLQSGMSYQWLIYVTDDDGATNVGDIWEFSVQ